MIIETFFLFLVLILIAIFLPPGEPISPHLLRYRVLAVKDHSFAPCASHLQQSRLVNNPGYSLMFFFTIKELKIFIFSWKKMQKNAKEMR
jgi:hypothetical protein